jgi:hypothetical protein
MRWSLQFTEVRFANEFITAIVVNPPEKKLAKRTFVCSSSLACTQVINPFSGTAEGP